MQKAILITKEKVHLLMCVNWEHLKIIEDPSKMLSAILIGNNVVNLYASSLATVLATHIWGNKIVGIATGILTLLILIFGEITPKTVATIQAERIAFRFAKIKKLNSYLPL